MSYVLDPVNAPERSSFAMASALGLLTGRAVLLEGPAATGKSALIEHLGNLFNGQAPLRVINTDSTTVQVRVGFKCSPPRPPVIAQVCSAHPLSAHAFSSHPPVRARPRGFVFALWRGSVRAAQPMH
jgi:hypothetical protein